MRACLAKGEARRGETCAAGAGGSSGSSDGDAMSTTAPCVSADDEEDSFVKRTRLLRGSNMVPMKGSPLYAMVASLKPTSLVEDEFG